MSLKGFESHDINCNKISGKFTNALCSCTELMQLRNDLESCRRERDHYKEHHERMTRDFQSQLKSGPESMKADKESAESRLASAEKRWPRIARYQPCGCVACQCEDAVKCHGCGGKGCTLLGKPGHPAWVYEDHPLVQQIASLTTQLREAREELRLLADNSIYHGNSVSYIYDKMECYGAQVLFAFKALRILGWQSGVENGNEELEKAILSWASSTKAKLESANRALKIKDNWIKEEAEHEDDCEAWHPDPNTDDSHVSIEDCTCWIKKALIKPESLRPTESSERCKHGVWKADHCYLCEKESAERGKDERIGYLVAWGEGPGEVIEGGDNPFAEPGECDALTFSGAQELAKSLSTSEASPSIYRLVKVESCLPIPNGEEGGKEKS